MATNGTTAPATLRLDGRDEAAATAATKPKDDWSDLTSDAESVSLAIAATTEPLSPQAAAKPERTANSPQPQPAQELLDPSSGEVIDLANVDQLAGAYERCKRVADEHYAARTQFALALAALTAGDAKTRRVRGQRYRVKVEMPDDGWDQTMLKEAWHSYPQHRESCLKIGTINVGLREWKKLANEAGPEDFVVFRGMIRRANRGPSGNPRVTVEAELDSTGMAHTAKNVGKQNVGKIES